MKTNMDKKEKGVFRKWFAKPTSIGVVLMALFAVGGVAAWLVQDMTQTKTMVVSRDSPPIVFSTDLTTTGMLDTTAGPNATTETAVITNIADDLDMTFDIIETFEDNTDACTDYDTDCVYTYKLDQTVVTDGDNLLVTTGDHDFNVTLTCAKLSCPQNASMILTMSAT